jgi:hypothetical protein
MKRWTRVNLTHQLSRSLKAGGGHRKRLQPLHIWMWTWTAFGLIKFNTTVLGTEQVKLPLSTSHSGDSLEMKVPWGTHSRLQRIPSPLNWVNCWGNQSPAGRKWSPRADLLPTSVLWAFKETNTGSWAFTGTISITKRSVPTVVTGLRSWKQKSWAFSAPPPTPKGTVLCRIQAAPLTLS